MMPGENKAVLITRLTASTEPSAVVRNPRGNLIGSLATLLEAQLSEGSRATAPGSVIRLDDASSRRTSDASKISRRYAIE